MEHLIQEIFLVVPNLGLRVAEGQYDLCGPQDDILSPSNWGSMIEPGWEVTMRMWPNPERPPWEYAGPRAMLQDRHNMLQDRHNIRSGRQDEASHHLVSQQEENDLHDSEPPRLGELKMYRSEEPTTQEVGGIDIEEQGQQARSGLHRKRLSLVSGRSQNSDESEGDHDTNVLSTRSGKPRLQERIAHHRRKLTTEFFNDSDIIVEERRPRTYARPPRKYLSQRDHGSDSDEWDGEYTTLEDQKVQYEQSEPPQSRDLGPHQTGDQITGRDSEKSLLAKKRFPASVRTPTVVLDTETDHRYLDHAPGEKMFDFPMEGRPTHSNTATKDFLQDRQGSERTIVLASQGHHASSYQSPPPDGEPPEGNRKQNPLILQERGVKARKQSVNETKTPSDDQTQEKTAPRPFRKEAPFGPYHHYQGRG